MDRTLFTRDLGTGGDLPPCGRPPSPRVLVWSRLNRAAEIVRPFSAAGPIIRGRPAGETDDGRDDILFRMPEIGDGDWGA